MSNYNDLYVEQFHYELPDELIAQEPASSRELSRLLHLNRSDGDITHTRFDDIVDCFTPGDLLVVNNARVIPARFYGHRKSGGKVEVFILDGWRDTGTRTVLLKPARRIKTGEVILLEGDAEMEILSRDGKCFTVRLRQFPGGWPEYLQEYGKMPLPPYIKRDESNAYRAMDRERYQTVYARYSGAVAAPTAGLHFTEEIFTRLRERDVKIAQVTLWVGWGTFKPVTVKKILDHSMESEVYSISTETAKEIATAKKSGNRVIAVGTTTTRALESWFWANPDFDPVDRSETSLYITPGYEFRVIDGLVTNFHLPGSTLLMMVSAFAGMGFVMNAYKNAVKNHYRFYSYGDAMIII